MCFSFQHKSKSLNDDGIDGNHSVFVLQLYFVFAFAQLIRGEDDGLMLYFPLLDKRHLTHVFTIDEHHHDALPHALRCYDAESPGVKDYGPGVTSLVAE